MESQNSNKNTYNLYVHGTFLFPFVTADGSENQQRLSVQCSETDKYNLPCQEDKGELSLPKLEDNGNTPHMPTCETSFHCNGIVLPLNQLVLPQQGNYAHVPITFPSISSENDTDNELENYSAMEVDESNKNTKLETGMCYQYNYIITR